MNPINPLKTAIALDAERNGFKNSEEYIKEYGKVAGKAAMDAGLIVSTVAFGGGAIFMGTRAGMFTRFWSIAKNMALRAWNAAKSVWYTASTAIARPEVREVIKDTTECVEALIPAMPSPKTQPGGVCGAAEIISTVTKELTE